VVFAQAVGELVITALAMGHVEVGHPRGELAVRLVYFVPAAAHTVVAERVAANTATATIALILLRLTIVLFYLYFFLYYLFLFCIFIM
jgi:hypothetical protein